MPKFSEMESPTTRMKIDGKSEMKKFIHVTRTLGERLSQWNSGMSSPTYAVSSTVLAGKAVPVESFMDAISEMEINSRDPKQDNLVEISEILSEMHSLIGGVPDDKIRLTLVRAMSRTMWALAWADEAEEQDVSLSGVNFYVSAPKTPELAYKRCDCLVTQILERNHVSLPEFIDKYIGEANGDISKLGFELMMSVSGYGGDICFEERLPYCEIYYYDLADKWIEE